MKFIILLALIMMPINVVAGDGHDHGDGSFAKANFADSFDLSEQAMINLDIKSIEVKKEPFKESITLPCTVKNPPEQTSQIHTTYIGNVKKIYARVGDRVKKDQILYTLFSMKAVRDLAVLAPIDGVVSAQNVSIGQIVQMEDTLMEITTNEYFIADGMAYLTDDISHIKIGDLAEVKIDGTHDDIIGVVQGFAPSVDVTNKTKSIFVDFKSDDLHVFPNMHCQMIVYYGEETQATVVPKRAVLGEFGNFYVFIQDGTHFQKEPVVLGRSSGDMVEILTDLHEGENVVVNGNYQLQFITPDKKIEDNDKHEGE